MLMWALVTLRSTMVAAFYMFHHLVIGGILFEHSACHKATTSRSAVDFKVVFQMCETKEALTSVSNQTIILWLPTSACVSRSHLPTEVGTLSLAMLIGGHIYKHWTAIKSVLLSGKNLIVAISRRSTISSG